ncbi:MAG: DUF72 domain-containing protein [Acidobacteriota bacterium]
MSAWLIGTSGFSYPSWRGVFYPHDLPSKDWLAFYQREFSAVELNVTFYRTPRESTVSRWADATGPDFRFVLKMPKLITHIKRLSDCSSELSRFWDRAAMLEKKLAAVLAQLPPSLKFERDRFRGFLALVPRGFAPIGWEARHKSFIEDHTIAWFSENRQSLVVADSGGRYPTVRAFSSEPAYLRFHGPKELYSSRYTAEQLGEYVSWVKHDVPPDAPVLAFFNNDAGGHAIVNARQLRDLAQT